MFTRRRSGQEPLNCWQEVSANKSPNCPHFRFLICLFYGSSNTPRTFLPQCLCTYCSLCLEHYLPRYHTHFLQVFTQMSSYERGCSFSLPPTSLSIPLLCFILLHSSYYFPTGILAWVLICCLSFQIEAIFVKAKTLPALRLE